MLAIIRTLVLLAVIVVATKVVEKFRFGPIFCSQCKQKASGQLQTDEIKLQRPSATLVRATQKEGTDKRDTQYGFAPWASMSDMLRRNSSTNAQCNQAALTKTQAFTGEVSASPSMLNAYEERGV